SARTSPTATVSPTLLIHLTRVPSVIVSLSLGISMVIGIWVERVNRFRAPCLLHAGDQVTVSFRAAGCRLREHRSMIAGLRARRGRRRLFPESWRRFEMQCRRKVCFLRRQEHDAFSGPTPGSCLRPRVESSGGR